MAKNAKKEKEKDALLDDEEETAKAGSESVEEGEKSEAEAESKEEAESEDFDPSPKKKPAKKEKAEADEASDDLGPKPDPKDYGAVVAYTKKKLNAGPMVRFFIPVSPGEQPGATEMVQINGYKLTIKKGVMVTIPEAMANVLAQHFNIEMNAGADMRSDRKQDIADALS